MPIRLLPGKLTGVFTKPALVSIFLLTNTFVWYAYAIVILQESIVSLHMDFLPSMGIWSIHFAALITSALLGVFLTKKLGGRTRFMSIWVLAGAFSSLAPLLVNVTSALGGATLGLVFGISLGFGMPNCMGYFTSQVPVENRGRIGGAIILLTGLATAGLDLIGINGLVDLTITLVAWRAISLVAIAFAKQQDVEMNKNKELSYKAVINQRAFALYFVPWILFSLLNFLTNPVQQKILGVSTYSDLQILENVFMGVSAVLGGMFMDSVGRKRLAIIGFVMLGLGYSVVGFFNEMPAWYLYTVLVGVSWGILYVLFVVTIWGDLSHGAPSDKFYALGVSPFFISKMVQLTTDAQIAEAISASTIFSFTALFLFLAVLPLVYAPETLPEKIMKERELKSYLEKAKEIAAKTQQPTEPEKEKECEDSGVEFGVENPEDREKAEELAQKYY